jgi:hypothetical protein
VSSPGGATGYTLLLINNWIINCKSVPKKTEHHAFQ